MEVFQEVENTNQTRKSLKEYPRLRAFVLFICGSFIMGGSVVYANTNGWFTTFAFILVSIVIYFKAITVLWSVKYGPRR